MKKIAFAVLIAVIAASPAAAAKKKAKKEAAPAPAAAAPSGVQDNNQNSLNLAKDALPVFLPSWSMPAYMAVSQPQK